MSGRNWSRKSIEELVEAYMRQHGAGKKYYDYCMQVNTTGYFEENNSLPLKEIEFGGDPTYTSSRRINGEHTFLVGGQKTELIDEKSTQQNEFGIPYSNTFGYGTLRDVESFQYVIMRCRPENGIPSNFITPFTSNLSSAGQLIAPIYLPANSNWDTRGNVNLGFLMHYLPNSTLAAYPYVLEYRQNDQAVKIKTWSEKAPNTTSANNQVGTENTRLSYTNGSWKLYNTSDMSAYCTKLASVWSGYTKQLGNDSTLEYGFLIIYRGARSPGWTPKKHIEWFLNRVTSIDTTNDWTHAQLT